MRTKNGDIIYVHMTCFWNNLYRVRLTGKPTNLKKKKKKEKKRKKNILERNKNRSAKERKKRGENHTIFDQTF